MGRCAIATALFVAAALSTAIAQSPLLAADEMAAVKSAEAERVKAIESVYRAVVAIYGNERLGGGSGVLFDPAGYVLTNHHVIAGAANGGWAGLADGKLYRWKLIGTDPGGDLAIIKLEADHSFAAAPLGDSDTVRVGDWAIVMGNPFALAEDQRPSVSLGIVSGVKRFQPGAGLNQLVYGNCIQVDSSINPGNSGGPLFNERGQIIGINGRGSFEERGRVNVGLGYAISSNQIKNFIPELLATKIAQHGTLDAVFGNREGGVICTTLNSDAPAAKAGLALGDKLLSFEGTPIHDANEFTNLISTYPAGWPVELIVEKDGERRTIHVRLTALPYERFVKAGDGKRPPGKLPKPDDKPQPEQPEPKNEPAPFPLHDAGKIRDTKVNQAIAKELLARWRPPTGNAARDGLELKSNVYRGGSLVGWQKLTFGTDGNIRTEYEIDGKRTVVACEGARCWDQLPDREVRTINRGKALLDPHFTQAVALSMLIRGENISDSGDWALDGADKANKRLCYRFSLTDPATTERLFLWLRADNGESPGRMELVKTGVGLDDDEPIASTLYSDFQQIGGARLPTRRKLVKGLGEIELLEIATTDVARVGTTNTAAAEIHAAPFRKAIEYAQQRAAKVYGAGIGRSAGYASGIIVGPEGLVLTVQGLFLGADDLRVTLPDGTTHRATVVRRSTDLQAALLKIEASTPEYFELPQHQASEIGDWVLAVSNAFKVAERHEPLGVNIGVLGLRLPIDARRGVQDFPYHADAFVYDAITSNPGADGGAVVSADGKLVGMIGRVIESKSSGTRLNYAVPVDLLAKFVAGDEDAAVAVSPSPAAKADLGIRLFSLGGRRGPAYVDRVVPGSPAAAAGLKTDDLIMTIAGQVVRDANDFRRIVESLRAGTEVVVEVNRKNDLMRVRITPAAEK